MQGRDPTCILFNVPTVYIMLKYLTPLRELQISPTNFLLRYLATTPGRRRSCGPLRYSF